MKKMMENPSSQKMVWAGLLLVVALISFFLIADSGIVQDLNSYSIEALDNKKGTVVALTAAAGASSLAINLIPGDAGSSIAQGIIDVVQYLVVVYAGIWAQKYLISITGVLAFKWLYPIACLLFAGNFFVNSNKLKKLAMRITLFSTMIFALIPTSVWVSKSIEQTYQTQITETIDQAEEVSKDQGILSKITSAVTGTAEKFKTLLNNMVDGVAVLIVTTCVIPIFVFFFFMWGTKLIFQLDVPIPSVTSVTGLVRKKKVAVQEISQGQED